MKKMILILACLSLIAGTTLSGAYENVDIHGFVSQGYLQTDYNNYLAETEDGSFEFNEMGLNFRTVLSPKLHLGFQFFARDLGTDGNDKLVLDWAMADYSWRHWLGFRVGRIKMPFGYYNEIRDLDMLRTGIFAPLSICPEILRDTFSFMKGVSVYGYVPMGFFGNLSYTLMTGLANMSEDTGYARANEDYYKSFNLKVDSLTVEGSHAVDVKWETPLEGLMIGFSAHYEDQVLFKGPMGGNGGLADLLGVTYLRNKMDMIGYFGVIRYVWSNLVLSAEYQENKCINVEIDLDKLNKDEGYLGSEDLDSQGWYGGIAYRFTSYFEAEYKYSVFYPDKSNKDGKGIREATPLRKSVGIAGYPKILSGNYFEAWTKTDTFSFRFDLNEYWLLKLEAAYHDGFGDYTSAENDSAKLERYWWLYAAKVTYIF